MSLISYSGTLDGRVKAYAHGQLVGIFADLDSARDAAEMAAAVHTACYYVDHCAYPNWIDACTDAAQFHGVSIHALADAMRAAGRNVPNTI